ncbi:MAG: potassium-transporting ATPase subunit KdpB, partial [Verrucomicrobia bacterium]|nr:potassium-transporting ATPase subunit KdpB [Verrucomicrobiota bacterium]
MSHKAPSLFDWSIAGPAVGDAFKKLDPRLMVKNPVMFVTLIGAVLTTVGIFTAKADHGFIIQLAIWLWFTVLFANFAEAVAEGRGKAQAASLRAARKDTMARRLKNGKETSVPAPALEKGDLVVCETGDVIPADGEVVEGIASVDEAAITGESAPVIRESGGDRSAVTGGTRVISDRIVIRITSDKGNTFIDRMIAMVEGAKRQKTPNEIALTILLSALTLIFLLVVVTLKPFGIYSATNFSTPVLIALLVCLIPTTIGGLLSAIGISGIDRLIRRNVMATSGRAVEAAGDIDVLLLDKTGTITIGNRMASDFRPAPGITEQELADSAQLASLADETPEGRSIVVLAKEKFNIRGRELAAPHATFIPFTAQTRMSGVDLDGRSIRKGAADSIKAHIENLGGVYPSDVAKAVEAASRAGRTPLVVCEGSKVLGVVELKDVVKGGMQERFGQLRAMGIRTVMITGDNPLTAAAIAAEAGVDDFLAQATPKDKMDLIKKEQAGGRLVAMTGDGTNDAPALAPADVGLAMNTGTMAAKEAGNMVDLDSNPTKLIEVVAIGKQLLMTRGALTTFSIANDVAKYFAILPA